MEIQADSFNCATTPAGILANRNNGRLIEHDTRPTRVNQRVGCAEIDGQVIGKIAQDILEHEGAGSRCRINAVI